MGLAVVEATSGDDGGMSQISDMVVKMASAVAAESTRGDDGASSQTNSVVVTTTLVGGGGDLW